MEIVSNLLLVLHFIGFSRLIGGGLAQVSSPQKQVNQSMFDGSLTQLVTGFALYLIDLGQANHMIVGIKILVLAVILVLVLVNRSKPAIPGGVYWGITGLAMLNVVIAVFGGVLREG